MHYLVTGEPITTFEKDGSMRLHTKGADGDPLSVSSSETGSAEKGNLERNISIHSSWTFEDPSSGIGGAYRLKGKKTE